MLIPQPALRDIQNELREAFSIGLPLPGEIEPHLRGALVQALEHPGRMVRARLVMDVARAYGHPESRSLKLAIAMEYFHTASLLFDDLPCMDDAAERRGEPCVHRTHGEAAAMLAALGLVNRAYALLWRGMAESPAGRQSQAGAYVEECLGVGGLLNGQSEDLHYGQLAANRRSPQKVAAGKTVSLIRLSLVLPALLGGAAPGELRLMERLAMFWGLSYQILDDLKDVCQGAAQTGKTPARDLPLSRPNLVLAIGARESLARLERMMRLGDRAQARLQGRLPSLTFLSDLRHRFGREIAGLKESHLWAA
jgi:geranylgeranyl pyrophosphate synthase